MSKARQRRRSEPGEPCSHPGCTEPTYNLFATNHKWYCGLHLALQLDTPENRAAQQALTDQEEAEEELVRFIKNKGKLT